jgi:hypothetical protein
MLKIVSVIKQQILHGLSDSSRTVLLAVPPAALDSFRVIQLLER